MTKRPSENSLRFYEPANPVSGPDQVSGKRLTTTGSADLDDDIQSAVFNCYQFFGFTASFYLIVNDDTWDYNAFTALHPVGVNSERYCEVGFGLPGLFSAMHFDPGGFAAMWVLSHEFGHVVQHLAPAPGASLFRTLYNLSPSIKLVELHADYLSGAYLGYRYLKNTNLNMSVLGSYIRGDNDRTDSNHHGTTDERQRSVAMGYQDKLDNPSFSAVELATRAVDKIRDTFGGR
jgi:hypothetical protein